MRGLRCWGILCAVVVMMSLVSGGCIFKRKSYDTTVGDEGIALAYDVPDIGEFVEADDPMVYEDILFDYDRSEILAEAVEILRGIAADLRSRGGVYLLIEGHCDVRGTREYNIALGERRALSAREFLAGLGVNPDRIATVSYGEDKPIDLGTTKEAYARNRRCHFKLAEM